MQSYQRYLMGEFQVPNVSLGRGTVVCLLRGKPPPPAWVYSDLYKLVLCWRKFEWTWERELSPGRGIGHWQAADTSTTPSQPQSGLPIQSPPHSAFSPLCSAHTLPPSSDLPYWVQRWSFHTAFDCSSTLKMAAMISELCSTVINLST